MGDTFRFDEIGRIESAKVHPIKVSKKFMDVNTEYNALRQEGLDLQKREVTITSFCLTATTALIAFALSAKDHQSYLLLLPLPIIIFGLIQIRHVNAAQMLITTYISRCLETKNDNLNWETAIKAFRRRQFLSESKLRGIGTISAGPYATLVLVQGVICSILSCLFSDGQMSIVIALLISIAWNVLAFSLVFDVFKTFNQKTLNEVYECWDDTIKDVND